MPNWMPAAGDDKACPTCNGAGYVRYERPLTDYWFGRLIACPKCATGRQVELGAKVGKEGR